MNTSTHPSEEDLVLHYYGELPARDPEIQQHLHACVSCEATYADLVRVLAACDDLPVPEPRHGLEGRVWANLEPHLHPAHPKPSFWTLPRFWTVGAIAALLVMAFLAGRFTRPGHPVAVAGMPAAGSERVLQIALGDHLERSQMVLLELSNTTSAGVNQQRIRDLLSENRLYRQTAAESGDAATAQVLDDLERVLLEAAHSTNPDGVRSRIEAEGLIFKLRVLGANERKNEEKL